MNKKSKKYSDLKIAWHPDKLRSFAEDKVTSPIFVRFKPTNKCQHNCFYCSYEPEYTHMHTAVSKRDEVPREKMQEILRDLRDMSVRSIIYTGGGEPLIYPHIEEALSLTLEYGLHMGIITNGQNLQGKKAQLLGNADWVRISLDYNNPQLFSDIRRVHPDQFSKLKDNISGFSETKKPGCNLEVNCVVHEKNREYLFEIAKFCKEIGIENVRFSPVWNPDFIKYHGGSKDSVLSQIDRVKKDLSDEKFDVYESFTSELSSGGLENRRFTNCYWMQVNPVIAADQMVYACHNKAYDPSGLLGSIKDRSFKDLWFSPELADRFKNFDPTKICRHQCSSEGRNKTILELLSCRSASNFI